MVTPVPDDDSDAAVRRGRFKRWLVLGNVFLVGIVIAMAAVLLVNARQALRERAQAAAQSLAASLQQSIEAELLQIDTALRNVILLHRMSGRDVSSSSDFSEKVLAEQLALVPELDSLRMTRADGSVLGVRAAAQGVPVNLADRDFFRQARDDPSPRLLIPEPVVTRDSGKWVIPMARRLEHADGTFAGVVYANVAADHFAGMFAAVKLQEHSTITLRTAALTLVSGYGPGPMDGAAAAREKVPADLVQALNDHPQRGTFLARTASDGGERIHAYTQVGEYPFLLDVASDAGAYLAPWHAQIAQVVGWVTLIVMALLAASAAFFHVWRTEADHARALQREGRRTRALLRTASDGIHVLDRTGHVVEASDSFAAMLGTDREAILGRHVLSWEAALPAREVERWLASFEPGRRRTFETQHRREDGTVLDVEVTSAAVRIEAQDFIYCSSRDVTARKKLEVHLAASAQGLRMLMREQQAMLDNDLIGIARLRDRVIVWKNQAVDRIFGYESDELQGRPMRGLHVDEETFVREGESAYPVLLSGKPYRQQLEMLRKDGRRIWIDSHGVLISSDSGESLWMFTDITPIKQGQQRVEHIAFHDGLTGLPNRLLLADRLKQSIAQAERHRRPLAVCYLDLDGFKQVNDAHGHAAGDELLVEVARRLQACVRANDTVSRLGGDEFVLLMTHLESVGECRVILERVRAEVSRSIHVGDPVHEVHVSASIGVAICPQDGRTTELLLASADKAMYQAKREGRDQVRFAREAAQAP